MSEPMSSVEIEDVLSSIRRLVSEDLRPAGDPKPEVPPAALPVAAPPVSAAAAEAAASKLILTPALRVVPTDPPLPEADEADADRWHDGAWPQVEDAGFVAVEDDDPEYQSDAPPVTNVLTLTPAPVAEAAPAPVGDDGAEDQAAVWVERVEDAAPEAWQDVLPEAAADWSAQPDDDLTAQDAAWADAAEAEVLRQLADDGAAAYMPGAPDDDMVYEETVLRELVRDIIREELQGALGERITRNVRKLVRAEIARALALRDFE